MQICSELHEYLLTLISNTLFSTFLYCFDRQKDRNMSFNTKMCVQFVKSPCLPCIHIKKYFGSSKFKENKTVLIMWGYKDVIWACTDSLSNENVITLSTNILKNTCIQKLRGTFTRMSRTKCSSKFNMKTKFKLTVHPSSTYAPDVSKLALLYSTRGNFLQK